MDDPLGNISETVSMTESQYTGYSVDMYDIYCTHKQHPGYCEDGQ